VVVVGCGWLWLVVVVVVVVVLMVVVSLVVLLGCILQPSDCTALLLIRLGTKNGANNTVNTDVFCEAQSHGIYDVDCIW
jgi:hypothetical protein